MRVYRAAADAAPGFTEVQHKAWREAIDESAIEALLDSVIVAAGGFGCRLGDLVHLLYVDPVRQREGLGRRLLAQLEAGARRGGIQDLRLHTAANARGFYEAAGYRVVREETTSLAGTRIARFVMEKRLY